MRTAIAGLEPEVQAQLAALDTRRADIARRYIERLRLEPYLGHRLTRGLLASEECRAVYFDRDSRPDDLFGGARVPRRRGDEDPSAGPGYRVVYRLLEARRSERSGRAGARRRPCARRPRRGRRLRARRAAA